jgi:hypothetical protein
MTAALMRHLSLHNLPEGETTSGHMPQVSINMNLSCTKGDFKSFNQHCFQLCTWPRRSLSGLPVLIFLEGCSSLCCHVRYGGSSIGCTASKTWSWQFTTFQCQDWEWMKLHPPPSCVCLAWCLIKHMGRVSFTRKHLRYVRKEQKH